MSTLTPPPTQDRDFASPSWTQWFNNLHQSVVSPTSIVWSSIIPPVVTNNTFFGGPTSGGTGSAVFRNLVNSDLPTTGIAAGSYDRVTVNTQGVVTAGSSTSYSQQVPTTGFNIAANTNYLVLVPAGTLATGTVTFPNNVLDGKTFTLSSTQTITALTLTPNTGQTINGSLTTLSANGFATWLFDSSNNNWYRIG
jgi:hypothetical protein